MGDPSGEEGIKGPAHSRIRKVYTDQAIWDARLHKNSTQCYWDALDALPSGIFQDPEIAASHNGCWTVGTQ